LVNVCSCKSSQSEESGAHLTVENADVRETLCNVGITMISNTALFTGLDLGQWIADTLSLSALPANLIAAAIATAFGLALTAASRALGFNSVG